MINIVIIAQNNIFRESLKTVLNQISGFKIIFDTDNFNSIENPDRYQIQLVLIDFSISKEKCVNIISEALNLWPSVRFLFMTNYSEEIPPNFNNSVDVIHKNASKKEFENKIRNN